MKFLSKPGVISSQGIDTAAKSKRTQFDDEGVIEAPKKPKLLLESDEDDEFEFPDVGKINFESKAKLSKLQSAIGTDERFIVDERFLEDEDLEEAKEENETDEYSEERKKQLEILGDILGKPISSEISKSEKGKEKKSFGEMIRYDPSNETHLEYEIKPEIKSEKVKKKKKKKIENVEEPESEISKGYEPVSKEIFYSVSGLSAFEGEEFSLLKTFGKESPEPNDEKSEATYESDVRKKPFEFDFTSKKTFAYDSSNDEEDGEEELPDKSDKFISENSHSSNFIDHSSRFLFTIDDPRFLECEEFFKNKSNRSEDLKTLRPKLKQTIRKRVRTNLKKHSNPRKKLKKKF